MRTIALVLTVLLSLVSAVPAVAQEQENKEVVLDYFWVEIQTVVKDGEASPQIDGLLGLDITGSPFGLYAWFQASETYSQAYFGPTYSLGKFQIGVGVGLESDPSPAKLGSFLYFGSGRFSTLAIFEYGGSGSWWKVEPTFQLSDVISVGALSQRFLGTGPRIEVSVPHTPVSFYFVPAHEFETSDDRLLIGGRLSF